MVMILTLPLRPAASTACAAPRPISSFSAKMNCGLSDLYLSSRPAVTVFASSVDQLADWDSSTLILLAALLSQPVPRSVTTDRPAGPSRMKPLAPSGKLLLTNSAACSPAQTLDGPMCETTAFFAASLLISMLRSTVKTGISASAAFSKQSSQPESLVADSTIASTSSLTNLLNA